MRGRAVLIVAAVIVASCTSETPSAQSTSSSERCTTANLRADAHNDAGAGGHLSIVVTVTNTGATACSVTGFPTATFVGADGSPVGPSSVAGGEAKSTTVTLAPREIASTTVWRDNPTTPTPSDCGAVTATQLRLELPDGAGSLGASLVGVTVCGSTGATLATAFVLGDTATLF